MSIAPSNCVSQIGSDDFEHEKSWVIKASLRQLAPTDRESLQTSEFTESALIKPLF